MKNPERDFKLLSSKTELGIKKRSHTHQIIAQTEAALLRKESQAVAENPLKKQTALYQEVSNLKILFT